jgi:hypothetical protein
MVFPRKRLRTALGVEDEMGLKSLPTLLRTLGGRAQSSAHDKTPPVVTPADPRIGGLFVLKIKRPESSFDFRGGSFLSSKNFFHLSRVMLKRG